MDVLIDEFKIVESWQGIEVTKSLAQDRVYVKSHETGKWVEYGLLGHASRCLSGLAGVPKEIGDAVAEACSKRKGFKVTFGGAPDDLEPDVVDDDFYEESDDE